MATCVKLTLEQLERFAEKIVQDPSIALFGPVPENDGYAFRKISSDDIIRLDYDRSYVSPVKEHLLPPCEVIARYNGSTYVPVMNAEKVVLFGVHPYDIKALDVLDAVYAKGKWSDPGYCKRREKLIIIGMDIADSPQDSFCESVGAHTVDHGFDLMLTEIYDEVFLVEIGSHEGEMLLNAYFPGAKPATSTEIKRRSELREYVARTYPIALPADPDTLAALLQTEKGKAVLAEMAEKCIACGNCTKVCPTCMCYIVHDTAAIDGTSERVRTRSSCIFNCAAMVAGEHNFRAKPEERLLNRLNDKTKFVPQEHGVFGCVGCGRCGVCPAGIAHIAEIFAKMTEEKQ